MTYETPGGTPHRYENSPPPQAPNKKTIGGLGWSALGVAGLSFLLGFVPFLGILLGAAAIALAIVALVQRRPKWVGVVGLILGSLALLTSLISTIGVSVALSKGAARPASIVETTPEAQSTEVEESDPAELPTAEESAGPEPEVPATPDLGAFGTIDDRTLSLIVKEPDNNVGQNFIVYGTITQMDSATGPCAALISIAEGQKESSFDYAHNTFAVSGDSETECPVFDPLVAGDHVKMWASVLRSFSYDTQIGGNTTVPALQVWQAERLPELEY